MILALLLGTLLLACAAKTGAPARRAELPAQRAELPAQRAELPAQRAELIYFVLVDRFANGDPDNDTASPGPRVDRSDLQAWHGGDLRGVLDHLDHIEALGATTVWLSPVFTTRTEPIGEWGAYHGYWQWDPYTVEPRFGTTDDLVALSDALRTRHMGLLLDLVTNHVGYAAPIEQQRPDWFHDTPSIEDWQDRVQLETWRVHGLPDLDQDQPEVAAWLIGAAGRWQELLGVRGFRVDAVRHVPNRFFAHLGGVVQASDPDAWWLGEDFTGDPQELAESQRSGGFSHVFDFPLYYAMTDVFCDDASPARLASVLWQDRLYQRPTGLVTFLDNHDLPRIISRCHGDPHRVLRALTFMFATRGVPSLSYGTEVLLAGAEEPENRGDMVFSDRGFSDRGFSDRGSSDRGFSDRGIDSVIQQLMARRAANPAMRRGQQRVFHLDADSMALARVDGDRAVIVGVNRGEQPVALALPPPLDGGALTSDSDGDDVGGTASHGRPGLVIPPRSVRSWSAQGDFTGWTSEGPPVQVSVQVRGAPAGELRLVGADPALGGWDPAAGLLLACQPDACRASLSLPTGAVLEGKPVVIDDSGVTWADGDNHALLVERGVTWTIAW